MQNFFTLDGKHYDLFVTSVQRQAAVQDGDEAGRTISGSMDRDIIGTYYTYVIGIDNSKCNNADYDEFYENITAPVESHSVSFPYGQSTLSFQAYVANATDQVKRIDKNGTNWTELSVQFTAMKPQRTP